MQLGAVAGSYWNPLESIGPLVAATPLTAPGNIVDEKSVVDCMAAIKDWASGAAVVSSPGSVIVATENCPQMEGLMGKSSTFGWSFHEFSIAMFDYRGVL